MTKQIVHTDRAPAAVGPYSQAIIANGFVFTAGQIALIPAEGKLLDGDVQAQTRQVMQNLQAVLEAAGTSLDSVVKATVYLANIGDFAAVNEVYGEFFPQNPPARSAFEVANLPLGALVEVEAVALLPTAGA